MSDNANPLDTLTPRELEVLLEVAEGYSIPEIAARHNRSVKTIEAQRLSLGRKLGAKNRVELVRRAIEGGLVSPSIEVTGSHSVKSKPWTSPEAGVAVFFPEEGRIRCVDRKYAEMHGYTMEEMEGMLVETLYEPEYVENFPQIGEHLREHGQVSHACQRRRKDGSKFFALVEATMMCGQDGEVLMYISTVRPASETASAKNGARTGRARPRNE